MSPIRLGCPTLFGVNSPKISQGSAAVGFVVWVVLAVVTPIDLIQWLLVLGPCVAVPLVVAVALPADAPQTERRLRDAIALCQPVGAGLWAYVFSGRSPKTPGLAFVWLAVCLMISLLGAIRLLRLRLSSLAELSINAGMIYLPVGAAWGIAHAHGWSPLGFSGEMVPLTGVHFHFAGLCAPFLVGIAARTIASCHSRWPHQLGNVSCTAAIVGPAVVAAGITFTPWLELPGAIVLTICLVFTAILNSTKVRDRMSSPMARGLLNVSSISLFATMTLACIYAYGRVIHVEIFPISFMAKYHGIGNSLGFATCGLVAWNIHVSSSQKVGS